MINETWIKSFTIAPFYIAGTRIKQRTMAQEPYFDLYWNFRIGYGPLVDQFANGLMFNVAFPHKGYRGTETKMKGIYLNLPLRRTTLGQTKMEPFYKQLIHRFIHKTSFPNLKPVKDMNESATFTESKVADIKEHVENIQ